MRRRYRSDAPLVENSSSSPAASAEAIELRCFYPEQIYLSHVLPTRSKRELREFKDHCLENWRTRTYAFVVFNHPLTEVEEFSSGPLNFVDLLWKTRVVLAGNGITEEYACIKRSIRRSGIDRATLEPAYAVHYPWIGDNWTVAFPQ